MRRRRPFSTRRPTAASASSRVQPSPSRGRRRAWTRATKASTGTAATLASMPPLLPPPPVALAFACWWCCCFVLSRDRGEEGSAARGCGRWGEPGLVPRRRSREEVKRGREEATAVRREEGGSFLGGSGGPRRRLLREEEPRPGEEEAEAAVAAAAAWASLAMRTQAASTASRRQPKACRAMVRSCEEIDGLGRCQHQHGTHSLTADSCSSASASDRPDAPPSNAGGNTTVTPPWGRPARKWRLRA